MEIERKYLIKGMPPNLGDAQKLEIEQGYLCTKPTVRIRKSNSDYILTYKRKQKGSNINGNPLMNEEIEVPLDKISYEHLKEKIYCGEVTRDDITRVTRRMGDEIGKVYGWTFPARQPANER